MTYQWILVILSSVLMYFVSPNAKKAADFFKGQRKDQQPSFLILTSSLVISWLFAKSITNSANLGLEFGMVGGVAYSVYYLSFIVAGIIIYKLRVKGGFQSIHEFLGSKFGRGALLVFSALIAFRLFNEIWSNTIVIGTYFGEQGSNPYYLAILVFTTLTLTYSMKGGMSSSLMTDLIQMMFFGVLITVILSIIIPRVDGGITTLVTSGEWKWSMGVNLIAVAFLQIFSYPFHDPVMTDRGFLSNPKLTLRSFLISGFIGGFCIILFSWVGIYGKTIGLEGQAPVEVSKVIGIGMMLMVNFIMITSAASTLDSTFSSFSKLAILDLKIIKNPSVSNGRIIMASLTILGTLPVFFDPEILSATTVSGTMVLGLAPIFVFWKMKAPAISFYLSIGMGLLAGTALLFNWIPESWYFTDGKYADLLTVNFWGMVACFAGFLLPRFFIKSKDFIKIQEN